MKILPRYAVILSYDEDQKLSVWWKNDNGFDLFFKKLKEGSDTIETTSHKSWFGSDSKEQLYYKSILMVVETHFSMESSNMLAEAKRMIADERAKTVSYFDFLALRKEFEALREQVKSKLRIEV